MRKSKGQLKRENNKLREKRERYKKNTKRLKELKQESFISSFTPIKIDGTGTITRLINKKGEVLPTETKMFGCDIEKSIPQFVRRFVDKIGLGEMIRVPIRTKGLTGSGEKLKCHHNVIGLVKRFGGKRLQGFALIKQKNNTVFLQNHSVWITPEGKCVDVTNNYDNREDFSEDCIVRIGNKEHIHFLPVGLGMIEELGVKFNSCYIKKNWDKKGIVIAWHDLINSFNYHFSKNEFREFQNKIGIVETRNREFTTDIHEIKILVNESCFSQRSIGNGNSWDELKREIVW